jgi:hypothetical protein
LEAVLYESITCLVDIDARFTQVLNVQIFLLPAVPGVLLKYSSVPFSTHEYGMSYPTAWLEKNREPLAII